ncbi:MAG TPA: small ribosomal subunit Rsm22 family protein [Desulfobacteria bacterium]|nr:small ribosomal subunit Rsm22 family protein [Desulfobacteria bacterium]
MTELEKLREKIEDEEGLFIPVEVDERVKDTIADLGYSCSETAINNAWKELKRNYGSGSFEEMYRNECQIVAYLRYYFFLNYPVIKWILLKNLERGTNIIPDGLINVLDYGAGPGTASLAICDFLKKAKDSGVYETIRVKLYYDELRGFFGECYKKMLREHEIIVKMRYVLERGNWYRKDFYNIILASYVLSELTNEALDEFLEKAYKSLKAGGYLIIIDSAYENARRWTGIYFGLNKGRFKIIDASGPLCFDRDCTLWGTCYKMSIRGKELRTPAGMTTEMKKSFEDKNKKRGKTYWVHLVLRKEEYTFVDPSRVEEHIGRDNFITSGWVIEKKPTERAENMSICNGLGRCNLALWRERDFSGQSEDISVGDILTIEGEYRGRPFDNLPSVNVIRVIEHIKKR